MASDEWRDRRRGPYPLPLFFGTAWEVEEGKGDRSKTVRYGFGMECGSEGEKRG